MKTDYETFSNIIKEAEGLLSKSITSSSPEFKAWKTKAERFLIKYFGENSYEFSKFKKTSFSLMVITAKTPKSDWVDACHSGIRSTIAIFDTYLEEMKEDNVDESPIRTYKNEKIFIVHGHDSELKESVARIIEKQEIDVIILSEQVNQGRTIIEKFEDYSDVDGAICLFTADDLGKEKNDSSDNLRARQNVVLETGFFMGKLGRNRIVILADDQVEMPSDLAGVVYTNSGNWQLELLKELKTMGYGVDLNKLL